MKINEQLRVWVNDEQKLYRLKSELCRFSRIDKTLIYCNSRVYDISMALLELDDEVANQNRLEDSTADHKDRWKVSDFTLQEMHIIDDNHCVFRCTWRDCYHYERHYVSRPMLLHYRESDNSWVVEGRIARGWFY